MGGLPTWAKWIAALGPTGVTFALSLITWRYVRLTRKIAKASADSVNVATESARSTETIARETKGLAIATEVMARATERMARSNEEIVAQAAPGLACTGYSHRPGKLRSFWRNARRGQPLEIEFGITVDRAEPFFSYVESSMEDFLEPEVDVSPLLDDLIENDPARVAIVARYRDLFGQIYESRSVLRENSQVAETSITTIPWVGER